MCNPQQPMWRCEVLDLARHADPNFQLSLLVFSSNIPAPRGASPLSFSSPHRPLTLLCGVACEPSHLNDLPTACHSWTCYQKVESWQLGCPCACLARASYLENYRGSTHGQFVSRWRAAGTRVPGRTAPGVLCPTRQLLLCTSSSTYTCVTALDSSLRHHGGRREAPEAS